MLWQPSLDERYYRLTSDELASAISARRAELGDKLIILGHHYQTDEVIRHADFTGDSLKLSQLAAERVGERGAEFIIFCGVHFMAETADLLAPKGTKVILPDLSAGCSMADMADYEDAIEAWDALHESLREQGWQGRIIPITYVNSTAAIKAFVGKNGGACCTSSNAREVFTWALRGGEKPTQGSRTHEDIKVLFLPDQHLGRNTAAGLGYDPATQMALYDPRKTRTGEMLGGITPERLLASTAILWAGHCSVHRLFRPEHCDEVRHADPETKILVHPECERAVVEMADLAGSTEFIIKTIRGAPKGSRWAVGTEFHLVHRLAKEAKERGVQVQVLSGCQCLCTTMFRIDEPHLLWTLDNLAAGKVVNQIVVHEDARADALTSLRRMLEITASPVAVD